MKTSLQICIDVLKNSVEFQLNQIDIVIKHNQLYIFGINENQRTKQFYPTSIIATVEHLAKVSSYLTIEDNCVCLIIS